MSSEFFFFKLGSSIFADWSKLVPHKVAVLYEKPFKMYSNAPKRLKYGLNDPKKIFLTIHDVHRHFFSKSGWKVSQLLPICQKW